MQALTLDFTMARPRARDQRVLTQPPNPTPLAHPSHTPLSRPHSHPSVRGALSCTGPHTGSCMLEWQTGRSCGRCSTAGSGSPEGERGGEGKVGEGRGGEGR